MGARGLRSILVVAMACGMAPRAYGDGARANPAGAVDVAPPPEVEPPPPGIEAAPPEIEAAPAELELETAPDVAERKAGAREEHEPAPGVAGGATGASADATGPAQVMEGEPALGAAAVSASALESRSLGPLRDGGVSEALGAGGLLDGSLVRAVGALGAVIALILVARWMMVRSARGLGGLRGQLGAGGRSPSGVLHVLGRYPVARGQTLVLLKLDRRVLLVCQTQAGFSPLAEVTDADEVASILRQSRDAEEESLASRFNALLGLVERDPETARTDDIVVDSRVVPRAEGPEVERIEPKVDDRERWSAMDGDAELRRRLDRMRGLGG